MRMMLRAVIDTPAGNAAIRDGSMGPAIEQMIERLHPEAAYFAPVDGRRSCLMVFDMTDPADLPPITEPLFETGNAQVTIVPCMNLDDLRKGLSQISGTARTGTGGETAMAHSTTTSSTSMT